MEILKGASVYHPDICAKSIGISAPVIAHNITKTLCLQSERWGYKHRCKRILQVGVQFGGVSSQPYCKKQLRVYCSFNSSSDGNGSMASNFNANDEDYVNSTVIEAVQVISEPDGFTITMNDGKSLRCIHNNPQGEEISDNSPQPAIVLKMEDGSGLLLPIVVCQMPSLLLMAAILNVPVARPTIYQVAKVMIEDLGWKVQVVRITKKVDEIYFAQLHLSKVGNETEIHSFDLRPSDAINLAVQCKVPIQVNRHLAYCNGIRVVGSSKLTKKAHSSDRKLPVNLDRPDSEPSAETKEFALLLNMLTAAFEERYEDAAIWRDRLRLFRQNMKWP